MVYQANCVRLYLFNEGGCEMKPFEQITLIDKLMSKMDVNDAIAVYCTTMATIECMQLYAPEWIEGAPRGTPVY